MNVNCIYKDIERPAKPKKNISMTEQHRLLNAVWVLKQQAERLQLQLSQIKREATCRICNQLNCQHNSWSLTISSSNRGIHVETSVKTLSDLEKFLKEGLASFDTQNTIRSCSDTGGRRMLSVTYPIMKIELLINDIFINIQQARTDLPLGLTFNATLDQQARLFKHLMLQNFFGCLGTLNPVLPIPVYYPKLSNDLDSLLTCALAGLIGYTTCNHVNLTGFSFTQRQLTEYCQSIAKKKLKEVLFEQEPTPEVCCALLFMSLSSILNLNGREAQTYSSLCWQIISRMKPIPPDNYDAVIQEQVRIRAFYLSRYYEFIFLKNSKITSDFTNAAIPIYHLPEPLACEMTDQTTYQSICCFRFIVRIFSSPSYINEKGGMIFGYFGGVVNHISSASIYALEQVLVQLLDTLPPELRIGNGPFEYTREEEVKCTIPFALRANAIYYVYWLNFQSKIMQSPQQNSGDAHVFRIGEDRALMIASVCLDTATKIYARLADVALCLVEAYWLAACLDIAKLISTTMNQPVQQRAKMDIAILSGLLKRKFGFGVGQQRRLLPKDDNDSMYSSHSQCSSVTSSHDSLCTEDTHHEIFSAPYFEQLKKIMGKYMVDNKIL